MITIEDLIDSFSKELSKLHYSTRYVRNVSAILKQIVKFHEKSNCPAFSSTIVEEYIKSSTEQFPKDLMMGYCSKFQVLTAQKLLEYNLTGTITDFGFHKPMTYLTPYYDDIIKDYVTEIAKTPQQQKGRSWAPKRLASWLLSQGISTFSDVNVQHIRQFLIDEIKCLKSKTIPSLRVEIRKFCQWTFDNDYTGETFDALFDFRIAIERKIKPAALPEEIASVLASIDRSTTEGKRNYAIVMLGVVTGLRGSDVSNLRLCDVDWRNGDIKITQSKTGKPLSLPLTQDVGESLSDYILNARPKSECDKVFLSLTPPFRPLAGGRSPGTIYINYRKKLGLPSQGFYSLRRALGKHLVTSGTPITTVAQVLGHSDITNTKQYIALDTIHLKECALDFTNITPNGRNV